MNEEKTGDNGQTVKKHKRWAFSGRAMLLLGGALAVILALVIGLNVGGLREELKWKISPPRIEKIAVLPFANLSNDPELGYVANGLPNLILGEMNQLTSVRVIAITSVTQYVRVPKPIPEIGRELNVDAVVQGSVLRSGDRIRINTKVIHAPTNRQVSAKGYDLVLNEVSGLQTEIPRDIVLGTGGNLTPREETILNSHRAVNPRAYDAYLRGSNFSETKRVDYFLKSIQIDPSYAPPYEYAAQMYYMRIMYPAFVPPREIYTKIRELAQKAIDLDPDSRMSHRILGSVALEYDWNFAEAEREFKRALEIVPNGSWSHHAYAHFLLAMGRTEEGRSESRRAVELDPMNPTLLACLSWHDAATGNHDEAETHSTQAFRLGAPDQLARLALGWSYALRGRHEEAIVEFQKAVVGWKDAVFPTAALGHAYAVAGQEDAAREVLKRLLARSKAEYVSPYEIAMVYAGLGDKDRAFEWLAKAYEERETLLVYFRMDPRIRSLRSDTRFRDLLRRMNFPQDRRRE